jgi:tRNA nucleotidyltransferase (CCA-adding enzyme)
MNQPAALWGRLRPRLRDLCEEVARAAQAHAATAYLVGGSVRDLLLGHAEVDLDLVIEGDALVVGETVAARLGATLGAPSEFLTTALDLLDGSHIDLATARQERYAAPAKLPQVEAAGIGEDLRRRDFAVNAMALRLGPAGADDLLDPCGGQSDLAARLIRALHERSFDDDPTRIIRAVRFEQRLGFALEASTEAAARQAIAQRRLEQLSGPRLRDELLKLLAEPDPSRPLRRLQGLGAAQQVLPGALLDAQAYCELGRAAAAVAALQAPGRGWPYLLGVLCCRGDWAWLSERLQLDAGARAVIAAMARGARGPLPAVVRQRRAVPDSTLWEALQARPDGTRVAFWLRGSPPVRRRLEREAGLLRRVRADIDGGAIQAAGVAPGPAIGVGLRAARAARLDCAADAEEQLRAALRAIAQWRRPCTAPLRSRACIAGTAP